MRKRMWLSAFWVLCVALCYAQPVVITPPSATIEPGGSVQLTASGALYYTWSPAEGLSTTEGPVTVASPLVTTTYTCNGFVLGDDCVVNGNFDQGNYGFTSAYVYNTNLWDEGTYYVDYDASLHHENFQGLGHGGTGNFMIVNGSMTPGTNVWTEQITVNPGSYYAFSTWVSSVGGTPDQAAQLQFSINGTQIGDIFYAPATYLGWEQFYVLWYSENSTTATITILNQNTGGDGNDFGLDDISFCELVLAGAPQCTVTVEALSAGNDAVATCYDTPVEVPFLDNDHLLQNCDDFQCQIIEPATNGMATYADERMTYMPTLGFSGNDQFRYRIVCGEQTAEAMVNVVVASEMIDEHTDAACEQYVWHGLTFTHSVDTTWTVAGAGAVDCDSTYVLHLTINHDTVSEFSVTSCEPYEWFGQYYSQPGDYEHHLATTQGCDSLIIMHFDLGEDFVSEESLTTCSLLVWHGVSYDQSGDYECFVDNPEGCDSIFRLHLQVGAPPQWDSVFIETCESYVFNDVEYTIPGVYLLDMDTISSQLGCDSIFKPLVLHLDGVQHDTQMMGRYDVFVASNFTSGIYTFEIDTTNAIGEVHWELSNPDWRILDSGQSYCQVAVLTPETATLSANFREECAERSLQFVLCAGFFDTEEHSDVAKVYPNPTHDLLHVEAGQIQRVRVLDMLGQVIVDRECEQNDHVMLNLKDLTPDIYLLEITTTVGRAIERVVVVH
ncbi:MAG: T9SS type A sorting domain-containing protein [Bacteroidales bacterium]|nr:T9SS type A sorting domain-containing protein [Bacteroidales bacterium]